MQNVDVAIVGGGILGLATAYRLSERFPNKSVMILEKESELAQHQTGHNSGVLHSGIYYKPGSLKAKNCRTGKKAMEAFCEKEGIQYDICGKVIVAVDEDERSNLKAIYERGQANGVKCEVISKERLKELEPHVAGVEAVHVPEAGIVNYKQVCQKLAERIKERGGLILTDSRVLKINRRESQIIISSTQGDVDARYVVNCAGLQCDRVTTMSGERPEAKIVPFRGEYYELKKDVHHFCRNLIYPVPNPKFPFLGVHFTRMIDGSVECGPNAVLAFKREGYRLLDINVFDLAESLAYPGFMRLALKFWKIGCGEMWRSISKGAFVKALQRLLPEIRSEHLISVPAGVRAQALSRDGNMVDDFLILESDRIINVNNAPSPAATSALNVGATIVDKLAKQLN